MVKTTVSLPKKLKASLVRLAAEEGCSQSALIREAIREWVDRRTRPRPVLPLTRGIGDPTYSERVDELLEGFGED